MTFDYFYGEQSEQFSFYRVPKVLFTDENFAKLSTEAKVLYGILLDRMSLSAKNGWMDKYGRVYIIFTIEEVMKAMNCADNKATKLFSELEQKAGLIVRKRQGLGKPNRIYVKNFVSASEIPSKEAVDNFVDKVKECPDESLKPRALNRDYHDSAGGEITTTQSLKTRCSNTDKNNTDLNDTDPFSSAEEKGKEEMEKHAEMKEYLKDVLEMDILKHDYPYEADTLDGILDLVTDVCCSKKPFIWISGEEKPVEVVKNRFMKLNSEHIRYVLQGLKDNTTRIRDPKQYMMAALYNAPTTMGTYYQSWVHSDMADAQAKPED